MEWKGCRLLQYFKDLFYPGLDRVFEDHENMVENLLMWTRDSKNKIFFMEREDKYDMFGNPQRYFLGEKIPQQGDCMDDHTKNSLVEEFFNHGVGVPEVESVLYLKAEGKKAWKKFPFVLRASGIYYWPKGKSHANSSKDLVCLAPLDHNQQVGNRKIRLLTIETIQFGCLFLSDFEKKSCAISHFF